MLARYSLYFAWLLACLGTLGSLYFSEILHLEPCHLCWYQRLSLFPLTLILGLGAFFGDRQIIRYALPLTCFGLLVALFQITIQEVPRWNVIELCGGGPPCSQKIDIGLGFITLPMLSAINFVVIGSLLGFAGLKKK